MAQIPTIRELKDSIIQNLEAELNITIPIFGKVFLNALAAVQAAKLKLIWLSVGFVVKNIFVDTADSVANGGTLERFGLVKLGREPFPATQGKYDCSITGQVGAVVSAGTQFKSDDKSSSPGKLFILDVEKTFASTTETIELRALEAGIDSRLIVTDTLTATSPLLNVDDQVTVTVENEIPLTAETIEDYRQDVINAFQLESQGGAASDYRIWSADAQGVRTVYPYAKSGECAEIELYVEANIADSTDGKGTPTPTILADVESVVEFDPDTSKPLNERGRRPLGVFNIDFLPITPLDIDITYVNPLNFDSSTQSAISSSIEQALNNVRPFVAGADLIENKNDVLSINKLITITQNLLTGNQTFEAIELVVDGNPISTSFIFTEGNIPYLNSITF